MKCEDCKYKVEKSTAITDVKLTKKDALAIYEHIKHGDVEHKRWLHDELMKLTEPNRKDIK